MCRRVLYVSAAAFAGCASPRIVTPPLAPVAAPSPVIATPAAAPLVTAEPPVYRYPKIGKIYLRAHEDAQGRLVGPQVIYQIVDPGGWNVDALERAAPPPPPAAVLDPAAGWILLPPSAASAAVQGSQPTDAK
jgi:hypothetical protein